MICAEFLELLDSYESLTDEQRAEIEKHTAECETCRKEFEFFKSVISNLSTIPSPKAPASLIDNVNAKLDAEKPTVIGFKWNFRVLSTVAACLAVGLAVGINNGYIKKNIGKQDTDGVIKETVVSTETVNADNNAEVTEETDSSVLTPEEPVQVAEVPVAEPEAKATTKSVKPASTAKPTKVSAKPTVAQQPTNNATVKEQPQTPSAEVEIDVPKEPAQPAPTVDESPNVDDYAIADNGAQIAYGRYNVEPNKRYPNTMSDYLHVGSNDMGTVVSTMSEMGVKNSGGYYMTSRQNFYALMDTLNDKGVGYECDLQYNSGENISFRLTYS